MAYTLNPVTVTNFAGSFFSSSVGYTQGTLLDDPVERFKINQGLWTSATPAFGGMGVTVSTANLSNEAAEYQFQLAPATSQANLNGWLIFNQANAMLQTPQAPVPVAQQNMSVNFVLLGSGARIVVACSSTVATAYENSAINTATYWDYTNQLLLSAPGGTAIGVDVVDLNVGNSMVLTNATTYTWNQAGSVAVIQI